MALFDLSARGLQRLRDLLVPATIVFNWLGRIDTETILRVGQGCEAVSGSTCARLGQAARKAFIRLPGCRGSAIQDNAAGQIY